MKLNGVLKDIAQADPESWKLVTEGIQLHLKNGGPGRVATLFLLANWKRGTDKAGVFGRSKLDPAMRSLDPQTGGSLLHYSEGRPEVAQLEGWSRKALTHRGTIDLAAVITPHLSYDRSVKAPVRKKVLALLARIPVTEFSFAGVLIRAVSNDSEAKATALVDYLMVVESARTLVASALQDLEPADANPGDFLRTQLRRSIDRSHPEWPETWEDPLSAS
jgi:hypothetical protein